MDNNPVNYTDVRGLHKDNGDGTATVEQDDNLSNIASDYGMTWEELYNYGDNKEKIGENPHHITPGQVLDVPTSPQEQKNNQQSTGSDTSSDDSANNGGNQSDKSEESEDVTINESDTPNDQINIYNSNDELLFEIKVHKGSGGYDVVLDTEIDIPEVIEVDMTTLDPDKSEDAVGMTVSYAGIMGGGLEVGVSLVYFQDGEDEGELHVYKLKAGHVGIGGGIGLVLFSANYNEDLNDDSKKDAKGFAGQFNAYSVSYIVGSYSKSWSNQNNTRDQLWPGQRGVKPVWTASEAGVSWDGGEIGKIKNIRPSASFSGGELKLIK